MNQKIKSKLTDLIVLCLVAFPVFLWLVFLFGFYPPYRPISINGFYLSVPKLFLYLLILLCLLYLITPKLIFYQSMISKRRISIFFVIWLLAVISSPAAPYFKAYIYRYRFVSKLNSELTHQESKINTSFGTNEGTRMLDPNGRYIESVYRFDNSQTDLAAQLTKQLTMENGWSVSESGQRFKCFYRNQQTGKPSFDSHRIVLSENTIRMKLYFQPLFYDRAFIYDCPILR